MEHFDTGSLVDSMAGNPVEYLEFIKKDSLSSGIYHLKAGATDPQSPHEEDEIYYVLQGTASFTASSEPVTIVPGSILYVAAGEQHRFHDIEEDLTLLVFFAA